MHTIGKAGTEDHAKVSKDESYEVVEILIAKSAKA